MIRKRVNERLLIEGKSQFLKRRLKSYERVSHRLSSVESYA